MKLRIISCVISTVKPGIESATIIAVNNDNALDIREHKLVLFYEGNAINKLKTIMSTKGIGALPLINAREVVVENLPEFKHKSHIDGTVLDKAPRTAMSVLIREDNNGQLVECPRYVALSKINNGYVLTEDDEL